MKLTNTYLKRERKIDSDKRKAEFRKLVEARRNAPVDPALYGTMIESARALGFIP